MTRIFDWTSNRLLLWLVIGFLTACLSGCGTDLVQYYFGDTFGSSDTLDRTAEQLALDGVQNLQEKKYDKALEAFQTLKERYPYSKYAILAELKIGDVYFQQREYADAALAYEEFARLHPRNEVVPYVLYQKGMCHFLSFKSVDRDPAETQEAIDSFQRLIRAFPDSEYSRKARKQLFECEKRQASHEFYVATIYFKLEKYRSAQFHLQRLTEKYPEAIEHLGYREEIERMQESCSVCINKTEGKPSFWSRIGF